MKFVKSTTWEKVFQNWRNSEADKPEWIYCATKIKGWPDWESWRSFTAAQLKLQEKSWDVFEFTSPKKEMSEMLIGPFSGWQARIRKKNRATFYDLIKTKNEYEFFKNNEKIISILNNQAFDSWLIGIKREDTNKIVCIEGHHRAVAMAIAKKEEMEINLEKPIFIALAKLPKKEIYLLDKTLEEGSSKKY